MHALSPPHALARRHGPPRATSRRCSYTEFFALYTTMMTSENYVLKRQSLKLLSEFLLDRENFRIMMRYISDK